MPTASPEKPRSRWRSAAIGFAVGASLPVGFGMFGMYHESVYLASLPHDENTGACGMGMLTMFMMIFIVGPFCGTIGALFGMAVSSIGCGIAKSGFSNDKTST